MLRVYFNIRPKFIIEIGSVNNQQVIVFICMVRYGVKWAKILIHVIVNDTLPIHMERIREGCGVDMVDIAKI